MKIFAPSLRATSPSAATAESANAARAAVRGFAFKAPLRSILYVAVLLFASILHRRLSFMVRLFETLVGKTNVQNAESIPATGSFVLAVNHFHGSWTPYVASAVLAAVGTVRPDAVDSTAMVIGKRADSGKKRPAIARAVRSVVHWILDRWNYNLLTIPLGNQNVAIDSLRTWRRQAKLRPTLVFPEGMASVTFERVRVGSGAFLRALGVPCIPCAVWFHNGRWHVSFGEAIAWSENAELSDLQVGLSIARMLPEELAPTWVPVLERWRKAHAPSPVPG